MPISLSDIGPPHPRMALCKASAKIIGCGDNPEREDQILLRANKHPAAVRGRHKFFYYRSKA